jgi:hypothetical protein
LQCTAQKLEGGGGELGYHNWTYQPSKESSGEWSAREPSAAGAGRVSTVSVLHGVPHRGYLWDEVAQRVDDELMGY